MKKVYIGLVAIILILGLSGCGSSGGSDTNPVHVSSEIDGTWDGYDNGSQFGIINVSSQNFILTKVVSELRNNIYGNYTMDGIKIVQPNNKIVKKVISRYTKYEVTPLTQNIVNQLNANNGCGSANWALNLTKNVTGTNCDTITANSIKQIYLIEGNRVIWGDKNNIGADTYPDSLDYALYWEK